MRTCMRMLVTLLASGGKAHVQNGDSGSYMDAIFELLVQKGAEIWTSLLSSMAYYSSQVSRVCVAILKAEIQGLETDGPIEQ